MSCRPELKGKLLAEGTWDFAIVDDLHPAGWRSGGRQNAVERLRQHVPQREIEVAGDTVPVLHGHRDERVRRNHSSSCFRLGLLADIDN
jgi:hypothetical protein